ncbi:ATP/GTP-binding protein [Ignisphaera sp. 4213-co]|uniref:ATP/GTP-binding protein n=1 Tax=Ignisphaera cupida TaxID=3050454 RepID=A0ABD4Z4G9_9CREN|nr:ATP/GTP-binding protein [Ignisphaera sp. 4213-co]MDK6027857.1 ATP/GTP-binding protein [Ignisphaera sp. 4213-co]
MYYVFMLGPAGSGKSFLAMAFHNWLEEHGLTTTVVNLDPAADWLPYTPDVDIRNYVTVDDVMKRYNLGPNGALIASVDLMLNYVNDLVEEINEEKPNYVIVDTPGQLEVFAFRKAGPIIIDSLTRGYKSVVLFLVESQMVLKPATLIPLTILSLATAFSHRKPQLSVITKIDLLSKEEYTQIAKIIENPSDFIITLRSSEQIILSEFSFENSYTFVEKIVENYLENAVMVSALTGDGIDELYAEVQRVFAGGEDFYTEEPSEIL